MMPERRRLLAVAACDRQSCRVPLGNAPPVVAVHEAGHAVVGVILGQKVARVTLRLTTYRAPPRTAREFYRAALVMLAGPCAEDRFCCYTRDQGAELWCGPVWRTDLLNAMHHLDASGGGAMAPVRAIDARALGGNRAGGGGADRAR
jgi:hypothetical protein